MADIVVGSGQTSSGIVTSGNNLFVSSGGTVSATTVTSGDSLTVFAGGRDLYTIVGSSGTELVSGGYVSAGELQNGAVQNIQGGTVIDEIVDNNAFQNLYDGVTSGTILNAGRQFVSGGVASGTTVSVNGLQEVYSGGIASSTQVGSSGQLFVHSGGIAANISGGTLSRISNNTGGTISGLTLTGLNTFVNYGGTLIDLSVGKSSQASVETGSVTNATVSSGGLLRISGGVVSGLTIENGATANEINGGNVSGLHVQSGGYFKYSGAATIGATTADVGAVFVVGQFSSATGSSYFVDDAFIQTFDRLYSTHSIDPLLRQLAGATVTLTSDSYGDDLELLVTSGTPCYCAGTLIDTEAGEVVVEALAIGDMVRTAGGAVRPIRWIGRRAYSGRFAAGNKEVLPVMFQAGSLGEGLPRQDLFVSPLHAMFIDDVLVPASGLVNGRTILQVEAMDEVSYFHIELDTHDVILANGAPSETFIDDDSREMFFNASEFRTLYPHETRRAARYCAPRIEGGAALEAIRQRLMSDASDPGQSGCVAGYLDSVSHTEITGWAAATATGEPAHLLISDRGVVIGEVIADRARIDIGRSCGFSFQVPSGLSRRERHLIEVRRADDGAVLRNAPWMLDAERSEGIGLPGASSIEAPARLAGCLDIASRARIAGWAFDPATPASPVPLQVVINGHPVVATVANMPRPDVPRAGAAPSERCGFDILLDQPLAPFGRHHVELRHQVSGAVLGEAVTIEPIDACDAGFERAVQQLVASVEGSERQERVLSFLLAQAELVSQAKASADSGAADLSIQKQRARRGLAEPPQPRHRALIIDSLYPDPDRDAGSVAVLSHARALQTLGYEVCFVASDDPGGRTASLREAGIAALTAPAYRSVEEALRRQADSFALVYLHRADNAARYTALVREHQRRARVIYSVADLHGLRLERQAHVEERPELRAQATRYKRMEARAMLEADAVLTHSPMEAALIRETLPKVDVHVAPWAIRTRRAQGVQFADRCGVLFLGNFGHAPNIDAAEWLVREIMPLVWAQDESIPCLLAGANMPRRVHDLRGGLVESVGHARDLSALLARVRLSVAPLRFGAGIKGKVLDSLAAGVPCVMTGIAAEGLSLSGGLHEMVANDAEGLARRIVRLHRHATVHRSIARQGQALIRAGWSDQAAAAALGLALQTDHTHTARRTA